MCKCRYICVYFKCALNELSAAEPVLLIDKTLTFIVDLVFQVEQSAKTQGPQSLSWMATLPQTACSLQSGMGISSVCRTHTFLSRKCYIKLCNLLLEFLGDTKYDFIALNTLFLDV